jgi:hypothetical protein
VLGHKEVYLEHIREDSEETSTSMVPSAGNHLQWTQMRVFINSLELTVVP